MSAEDREKLDLIASRSKSSQSSAVRARIVLHCSEGLDNEAVAAKLNITAPTVGKWWDRYRVKGMEGLLDEPRVGAPRKIGDEQIEAVVTKTLETMPDQGTHWSTRLIGSRNGNDAELHRGI